MNKARIAASLAVSGADKRSRTPDLRITNALLYQLSYTGQCLQIQKKRPTSQSSQDDFMSWLMVLPANLQIGELGNMDAATALEKIEQSPG